MALQSLFKKCSSHYLIVAFFDGPVLAHFCPFFYFFAAMWVKKCTLNAQCRHIWFSDQKIYGQRKYAFGVVSKDKTVRMSQNYKSLRYSIVRRLADMESS